MAILSLKGILLSQLYRVLLSEQGSCIASFIEILHGHKDLADASSSLNSIQPFDKAFNWQEIPLTKTQDIRSVLYISALPQKLAKKIDSNWGLTLAEISQQIGQRLDQVRQEQFNNLCVLDHKGFDSSWSRQLWFEFKITTQPPEWITFCLSDQGVALWLQHAQQDLHMLYEGGCPVGKQPLSTSEIYTSSLWQMQYNHARCCTLLALWQRSQPDQGRSSPLPWPTGLHSLRAFAPQAQHLTQALIDTADDTFWIPYRWPDRQHALLLRRATHLCQSFDQFHRGCLYGFSQLSPTAAPSEILRFEANFGLVAATRNLLKILLYKHFNAESPTSL